MDLEASQAISLINIVKSDWKLYLASDHPPSLFLFRHFLPAGHDAGLGQRCARLEPVAACGRLVPGRLLRCVPTALARPLVACDPGDPAVALLSPARARDAAPIVR